MNGSTLTAGASARNIGALRTHGVLFAVVLLGILASLVYFSWWVERLGLNSPWLWLSLILMAAYVVAQIYSAWALYLHVETPAAVAAPAGLSVDVLVPVYNEPYELVERSLAAAVAIRYPHQTYLLDDGPHPRLAALAARLGVHYLTRAGNGDAKAGNVNAALARTTGEFVTIFDVDHVPEPNFLGAVLGHFTDPAVGFVQSWVGFHNHGDSLVARAAAEQGFDPYGPTSMGMYGCGAAPVWGSHCTFRRRALQSIGGHQAGLAEDLHTSLRLHAAGWRSVFVPSLDARGQTPSDLIGITAQHFKWSRGVFEVLFTVYPCLCRRLTLPQNAAYLVRLTYYLIGPIFLAHALVTAGVLLFGSSAAVRELCQYLLRLAPLALAVVLVRQLAMHLWHLEVDARGLTWRGYALSCTLWPVYTLALLCALLRVRIPHLPTAKQKAAHSQLPAALPQLTLMALLLAAVVVHLSGTWGLADAVVMVFALLATGAQSTAAYAALRP
ncbi:MAG: glycosyltransferase [Deltaproteobacteria bacterium]|nr:glycosyltransferase [Deltaproteobacteria bacterium]